MRRQPTLRQPARADADRQPGPRQVAEAICRPTPRLVRHRQKELLESLSRAKRLRDAPVTIDRVRLAVIDPVRVEPSCPFPRRRESDANLGACRAAQDPRPQKSLQIDRQVEPRAPQRTEDFSRLPHAEYPALAERAALKGDGRIEVRMTAQEWFVDSIDEPGEPSFRKSMAQGRQHRQTVHDVAERARLDEQDISSPEAFETHVRESFRSLSGEPSPGVNRARCVA